MNDKEPFGSTARALARNPIGIVALFLVLIYSFAALLLGISGQSLTEAQRWPFVWFLVAFPALMLGVFTYLVVKHHEKLYAPSEYRDERHFFKKLSAEDQKQKLDEQVDGLLQAESTREKITQAAQGGSTEAAYRSLTRGEIRQEISIAEDLAFRALEEEFGCSIARQVGIPAGKGWLNLDGAVARGEELVAIEVKFVKDGKVALFQLEHLVQLLETLKFDRFTKVSLLLTIVSDASEPEDQGLKEKLRPLIEKSRVPITLRVFRLNLLKARYGL